MTEEEAKTKWCPHVRAVACDETGKTLSGSRPFNRKGVVGTAEVRVYPATSCIGSACMAWRWNGIPYTDNQTGEVSFLNGQPTHGHCGLAGSLYR